jgi:hypothetical protein
VSVCEEGRQAPPAPWPALAPTLPHSRQSAHHTFVHQQREVCETVLRTYGLGNMLPDPNPRIKFDFISPKKSRNKKMLHLINLKHFDKKSPYRLDLQK